MLCLTKNKKITVLYDIVIAILALIAVTIAFIDICGKLSPDNYILVYLDKSILIIFTIDYFTRLFLAKNKKEFFKSNILDLIAIIPFNSMFRVLRVTRLLRLTKMTRLTKLFKTVRLIRFVAFSKKFAKKVNKFLRTNGFIYNIYITFSIVIIGAISIYIIEKGQTVDSLGDAVWWSFVTTTTVGYGDISPSTSLGRIVASILMLAGIGFIGMLTGTITTYFSFKKKDAPVNKDTTNIIDVSDLGEAEVKEILRFVEFVRSKKAN
ncbi:ion transporter [Abyssisolibacter fermentans]|uniref:ion transporter n=1 Tax=Abyssisolibacter fermentans TaxID=1766203 RepID=UPI0008306A06|nr:ion transporter [Abyssisolibacter fermentans]